MAQARTLDDAQIKRVQRYLRTRRNHTRDSTIFTFAFNTGLRAKELAALRVGDAYDAEGAVRDAFVLQRSQTKGARTTRTVYINRTLRSALEQYRPVLYSTVPNKKSAAHATLFPNSYEQLCCSVHLTSSVKLAQV